ncbi:fasciclin-2 isoform X2 [Aethina tumida]|uniref:fasciclin-2 isoform X2 n=1 Tax=Aethina tumida TaxID=116153 RepID=UPI00214794B5|nr:fasciclin-2 isoform X2 [Aethina tumida]
MMGNMRWFVLCSAICVAFAQDNPSLEIQPNSVIKAIGTSLALTCRPKAEKPNLVTQLEWRDQNGRKIESIRSNPLYTSPLTGEPGILLIFASLTENQGGTYTCQANYASETIRAEVPVRTYVDIDFVDAPESQYPVVGTDYTVKCKVIGNPSPTIDWNKNGISIKTTDKYIVDNDQLLIRNVTEADDGVYKCTAVVVETGRIKTRDIKVEVQVPPKIEKIENLSVIEGVSAEVVCKAYGKPPPTYTWIKEKTRENLEVTDRFDVKKNEGKLIINRVEFNDDSMYKCTAENPAGRASETVKINVLVKPKIYELLNVTSPTGSETKLICKTQGRPPPKVLFKKVGSHQPFITGKQLLDNRITTQLETFDDKGEAFGILNIKNLNRSDDGLYECIAENTAGIAYKNGHITVEFMPNFDRFQTLPSVWSWNDRPGNLSCIPEAIPNATIVWKYNNIIVDRNNSNFQIIGNGPVSNLIVYPFNQARFFTQYECVATNKLGTNSTKIWLKQGFAPKEINQIRADKITATSITFSIVPPSLFDGLPIRTYTVRYKIAQELSWENAMNHTWSSNSPYILENLYPEATYHFTFAARNDVGMGPWRSIEAITMPRRSEPSEPKILVEDHNQNQQENAVNREDIYTISQYADHYELRWNVPNDNGDPIQHYLVRYCETNKINGEWRDSDCSEQFTQSVKYTSFELDHLKPDTVYKIELRAHNSIGDSSPAQIKIKTAQGRDPVIPVEKPAMSSGLIVGIVVVAVLVVVLVVDLTCFFVNRMGILACMCASKTKQHDDEDPKLSSLYSWRFPLPYCSYKAAPAHPSSLNLPQPIKLVPTPTDEREPLKSGEPERPTTVEYDGKHVYTKSGEIIGKHSAV